MTDKTIAQALTIAGSDSGGGAGIQADLKTFQMRQAFGLSVITAITAQNTLGVFDIHAVPTTTIEQQIKAIADDFTPTAFKIGMLGTVEIIECVASALKDSDFGLCVLDPVMIAKGGSSLLQNNAIEALKTHLLPLADVITPNMPEAEALTDIVVTDKASAKTAAIALQQMGAKTVVIKGGHGEGAQSTDYIFTPNNTFNLTSERFNTKHTHGTGCTFSACIAAELAKGETIDAAIHTAKSFITAAISNPLGIGHGHGPTNHWAYKD